MQPGYHGNTEQGVSSTQGWRWETVGKGFWEVVDSRSYMKHDISGALSRRSEWREMKLSF